jgi:hypothetical protein
MGFVWTFVRRFTVTIATAVAFLAAIFWWRSATVCDDWTWTFTDPSADSLSTVSVSSLPATLAVGWDTNLFVGPMRIDLRSWLATVSPYEHHISPSSQFPVDAAMMRRFDFHYMSRTNFAPGNESSPSGRLTQRSFNLPYWSVVSVFMLPGTLAAALFLRRRATRRKVMIGRCPKCGYDLRATPQRCPECGWPAQIQTNNQNNRNGPKQPGRSHLPA